jgi:hypothetical protein
MAHYRETKHENVFDSGAPLDRRGEAGGLEVSRGNRWDFVEIGRRLLPIRRSVVLSETTLTGRRGNSTLNLFARCLGPQAYGSRCRRAEGIPRIESAHFAADPAVTRLAPRRLCLRGSRRFRRRGNGSGYDAGTWITASGVRIAATVRCAVAPIGHPVPNRITPGPSAVAGIGTIPVPVKVAAVTPACRSRGLCRSYSC